ncbi:Clp protease N-terminal domain-containing protein [Flexivirga meconopsidis]|uniref:Clp protease N-terminal domain-containing protein n=1 Tax=Flexivirga meconopsidis TaxID=2977121 RepID=UPI00223F365F|nr:Clp protease N-terminal domain-containing protein [Flexivirga meconopsidis]
MFNPTNSEIRIAMMQAADEQRELGHDQLGADHLLLGLLSNVRGSAYKLLTQHGVSYELARQVVVDKHREEPEDQSDAAPHPGDASSSLDDDREALRAIGIDLDKVRAAVRDTFGDDITDGWGERRGPRRGGPGRRGRGPGGHGQRGGGPGWAPFAEDFGEWGRPGRGRRGPRSRRGFGNISPGLQDVMRELSEGLRSEAVESIGTGRAPNLSGARLLSALLHTDDPVVGAIVEAADNPRQLIADADELAGKAPTT